GGGDAGERVGAAAARRRRVGEGFGRIGGAARAVVARESGDGEAAAQRRDLTRRQARDSAGQTTRRRARGSASRRRAGSFAETATARLGQRVPRGDAAAGSTGAPMGAGTARRAVLVGRRRR